MSAGRSTIASIALALAAISALGFLVLAVGNLAGIEGAGEGEDSSLVFSIAWFAFTLGGVAALVTGVIALVTGSRSRNAQTRRAGVIAVAYVVAAIAAFVVINAVS